MIDDYQIQALGQFAFMDFTLEHDGAMVVELRHEGKMVARFCQSGTNPDYLQAECGRHLVKEHNWDCCIWSEKNPVRKS